MCRCGTSDLTVEARGGAPVELRCPGCGRRYSVSKLEKRTRINNLPMSFGFRSLYWDKIESGRGGLAGVSEQGYEIQEIREEE